MIAAILDASTLGKVILYSLISGIGISTVFALGVSSAAGLVDAIRQRRVLIGALWGLIAALCAAGSLVGIALGVAAMAAK